ncbi:MFS transporter [Palleronia sp. KMU-117]|uniref:MFS transporter n=1 Tax=Palleronia sp. KMU-117 TaxID=3434108 RepID=UPI003D73CA24
MERASDTPRTGWLLVFLLYAAGLGAAAQYGKVSVVFDRLPELWPGAGPTLGFALSLVGFVGILLGVTAGIVVAKVRYRRAMIWALWAGAAISAFQATLPPLPLFLASRVLEGMSHLALVVAAPTLIAQLSAPEDRGVSLTLWGTFFGVAFTILVWAGIPFADRMGLPGLFLAHAAYMAVCAVILTLVLPRVQAAEAQGDLSVAGILRRHGAIYRSARISAPAVAWLSYTFTYVSLLTLLPPFIAPEWRVLIVGGMPLVSIASSLTLGVALLRRMPAVRVIVTGFAGAGVAALALAFMPGNPALCLLLAAALGLVQGAGFAAVPELNQPLPDRAAANGALAQTGNIGNTLGPPLLLAVATLGGYAAMMLVAAAILAAGILGQHWLARRRAAGF